MDPCWALLLAGLAAGVAGVVPPAPAPDDAPIRLAQLRPADPRPPLAVPALPFRGTGDLLRPAQLAARRDLCEQIDAGERPAIAGLDCAAPLLGPAVHREPDLPAPGRTHDPGAGAGVPVPGGAPQRGVVLLDPG